MTPRLLKRCRRFLEPFISSKIVAAGILTRIPNLLVSLQSKFGGMELNPLAVRYELSCWAHSLHFTEKYFFKTLLKLCGVSREDFETGKCDEEGKRSMIEKIHHACKSHFHSILALTCCNCTPVRHAVGGHVDVFAKKKPSLENRLVFAIRPCVGEMKKPHEPRGHGRGGVPNRFVFCVPDWAQTRRNRIDVWGHPRNQHIPGA